MKKYYSIVYDQTGNPYIYSKRSRKILKTPVSNIGYRVVNIYDPNKMRTQTMTFARALMMIHDPRPDYEGLQVDHINRDKTDDRIENLRWVTPSENRLNTTPRDHYKCLPKILVHDYETNKTIIWSNKDQKNYKWPRQTIIGLARGKGSKETPHYSKKHNIACFFVSDIFNKNEVFGL